LIFSFLIITTLRCSVAIAPFFQIISTGSPPRARNHRTAVRCGACIFADIYKRSPRFRCTARSNHGPRGSSPHLRSKWWGGVRGGGSCLRAESATICKGVAPPVPPAAESATICKPQRRTKSSRGSCSVLLSDCFRPCYSRPSGCSCCGASSAARHFFFNDFKQPARCASHSAASPSGAAAVFSLYFRCYLQARSACLLHRNVATSATAVGTRSFD
jgi:hypothetical protein